uniref:BHLH domain-containing protein n=1 Tax=Zea mays TaxID=4577 RepID=B6TK64_MAIZE|nr:hypothetical protein [Zea mays]|eukprot:NP_001144047.1 uncharacterized protein LOC100276871 [Zea mays]
MAGGGGGRLPLDLSLATAGPSAGERRPRARPNRRTLSSLYAELGAMLPNLPIDRPASKEEIVDAAAARVEGPGGHGGRAGDVPLGAQPPPRGRRRRRRRCCPAARGVRGRRRGSASARGCRRGAPAR